MAEIRKEVFEQFMRVQGLLRRFLMQSFLSFGPWGNPHRGQGRVLAILKMKPEISQKELCYLLDISKQSLAEILNKLEKNGYITREKSLEDNRVFRVKLTEKGAVVASDIDEASHELEAIFDCLSEEELVNLNGYLKRIEEQLERQSTGSEDDLRKRMRERFMEHRLRFLEKYGHPLDRGYFLKFFGGGFCKDWDFDRKDQKDKEG